jgi:sialate O-acetylesterase
MRAIPKSSILLLSMLAASVLTAEVRLPSVFCDHMVLQRDMPVHIWGKADAGESVTVRFHGQTVKGVADSHGKWSVFLAPVPAGGPFDLTVEAKNSITLRDVLMGDVWVASGQSNMAFQTGRSDNAEKEVAAAWYPQIRLFKVPMKTSEYPLDDVSATWSLCTPESVKEFTAVGYFFARRLRQDIGVPIGVIQTAWGGTSAEAWTSGRALAADPALVSVYADWAKAMEGVSNGQAHYQNRPSSLYNAMIAPLTPFAIRGAIWYQGENNAVRNRGYVYRRLFQAMIEDWRRAWGQGDFPFLFVQLANFAKVSPDAQWSEVQEAQTMALQLRNTGMAVTIDIGNPDDIHPRNKQDVGARLALAAETITYGKKIVYSGPIFRQATVEGDSVHVWFDHVGGGLMAKGGDLKGWVIAGTDRKFVPAEARIDKNTVVVRSPNVPQPVYVRYAWAANPECNLFNVEGLPASPFRSDEWIEPAQYR